MCITKKKQSDTCLTISLTTVVTLVLFLLRSKLPDFILNKNHLLPKILWEELKGTRHVASKILHPTLQGCKWGYLVFHGKRLEPRVLPWQCHSSCHSVPFVLCISCAKFEEHYFIISIDILDSVFEIISVFALPILPEGALKHQTSPTVQKVVASCLDLPLSTWPKHQMAFFLSF